MASGDREAEKRAGGLVRREFRTEFELECKSRSELQSLVKDVYGLPANLKSSVIIDGILHCEYDDSLDAVPYHAATYIETMEAVRLLMKRINETSETARGAKCILDCVMKVEAELLSELNAIKPAFIDHKVPYNGKKAMRPLNTMSSCATAVKAVQQVIGVEFVKPGTGKPVGVKSEPAVVESIKLGNGDGVTETQRLGMRKLSYLRAMSIES